MYIIIYFDYILNYSTFIFALDEQMKNGGVRNFSPFALRKN